MKNTATFEINKFVVHDLIDNEIILVHLEKGHYYSLLDVGRTIWECICAGQSVDQINTSIDQMYDARTEEISDASSNLVNELINEEIIRVKADDPDGNKVVLLEQLQREEKLPFTNAKLEKCTDLERLLLLDPVHEVDEQGWPNKPEGA